MAGISSVFYTYTNLFQLKALRKAGQISLQPAYSHIESGSFTKLRLGNRNFTHIQDIYRYD